MRAVTLGIIAASKYTAAAKRVWKVALTAPASGGASPLAGWNGANRAGPKTITLLDENGVDTGVTLTYNGNAGDFGDAGGYGGIGPANGTFPPAAVDVEWYGTTGPIPFTIAGLTPGKTYTFLTCCNNGFDGTITQQFVKWGGETAQAVGYVDGAGVTIYTSSGIAPDGSGVIVGGLLIGSDGFWVMNAFTFKEE